MSVSYIKSDAVGLRVGFSPRTVFVESLEIPKYRAVYNLDGSLKSNSFPEDYKNRAYNLFIPWALNQAFPAQRMYYGSSR